MNSSGETLTILFLPRIVVVSCRENDCLVAHAADSVIGYGNLVRVLTNILKDLLRAYEGLFDIDVPLFVSR